MPRYSRKHKRGGRPPNTSTDDARGNSNGQRLDNVVRDNAERENNLAEPYEMSREPEIGQVDPRSVGLNEEQADEYHRGLEEGNRLAAQDRRRGQRMERRMREGRQGQFTRIHDDADDDDDDDDNSDDQFAGRKRRKTVKKRKTSKKRKTVKKRKTSKKR